MTAYEVEVRVSFDDKDLRDRSIADIRTPADAHSFVDRLMQQAHNDASRRNLGNFPGWHYELLEDAVGIVDEEFPFETVSPPTYQHTHVSVSDGSPAMRVTQSGLTITLVNEDGFQWTDRASQWRPIEEA